MQELTVPHSGIENSDEKYQKAMEILDFLKDNMVDCEVRYDLVEKGAYDRLKESEEYYIQHEYLEGTNIPLYFYQFANMLEKYHLTYVMDADIASNFQKREFMNKFTALSYVAMEQYRDFITNKQFRSSILTKQCNQQIPLINHTMI